MKYLVAIVLAKIFLSSTFYFKMPTLSRKPFFYPQLHTYFATFILSTYGLHTFIIFFVRKFALKLIHYSLGLEL